MIIKSHPFEKKSRPLSKSVPVKILMLENSPDSVIFVANPVHRTQKTTCELDVNLVYVNKLSPYFAPNRWTAGSL